MSPRGNNPQFNFVEDTVDLSIEEFEGIDILGGSAKSGLWMNYEQAELYVEELPPIDLFGIKRKLWRSKEGGVVISPVIRNMGVEVEEDVMLIGANGGE